MKSKKNQYKESTNSIPDRERKSITTDLVDSATHRTGIQHTNAQHSTRHVTTVERRAILHGHAKQSENYKNKFRNVTETENLIGEESDDSQSSK